MIDQPVKESAASDSVDPIIQSVTSAYSEAKHAKTERMIKNSINFNAYHLKQDWSHKQKGQSKEFLPKQAIATEQLTSFIQQALLDINKWFEVRLRPGVKEALIAPEEMQKILERQLDKNNIAQFMADTIKHGLLASLMIVKVHGKMVECPQFVINRDLEGAPLQRKRKKYWQLKLDLIRAEDWFPDPTGNGLYEIQRLEMDYHELLQIAKDNPDVYDLDQVRQVKSTGSDEEDQRQKKYRETAQNPNYSGYRKRVVIKEFWGTILDPVSGEVLHENIVCAVANNKLLVRPPKPNPYWHNESPFVAAPILRVPHSVWGKALMDAPTNFNLSQNEIYNLILDAGLSSVFGIRQLREQWLANPEQVNDGIAPGTTLIVNNSCPPGQKVLERVDSGSLSMESLQVYNLNDREFQASSFTNDTRLGVLPQRAVKATEIVASQNAITGTFNGIVKVIEKDFITHILEKAWKTLAQHMDDLHVDEVKALIGEDRALKLSNLAKKEVFAGTVGAYSYHVYGLSSILNKMNDFQKITSLLQTVGGNPVLTQEFQKKYSFRKLLGEIVKSLDIDEEKISASEADIQAAAEQNQMMMQAHAGVQAQSTQENPMPDAQSQIKNVGNMEQQPMPRLPGITQPR